MFLASHWIRDCRQITFVTLNRFFSLSKPTPLFLTENIKMDRIPTKSSEKYMLCPFYIVFQVLNIQVLNIHLTKICKIEPPDLLFLVVFISFYISRYIIFRTSFNIISKKNFRHEFFFLTDSLKPTNFILYKLLK